MTDSCTPSTLLVVGGWKFLLTFSVHLLLCLVGLQVVPKKYGGALVGGLHA
jgi:hypothetical protein